MDNFRWELDSDFRPHSMGNDDRLLGIGTFDGLPVTELRASS